MTTAQIMSNKIPTAEEVLKKEGFNLSLPVTYAGIDRIKDAMKRYAQLHVEAALKAASEKAEGYTIGKESGEGVIIDKRTILNAYPKTNII